MIEIKNGVINAMDSNVLVEVTTVSWDLFNANAAVGEIIETTMVWPRARYDEAVMDVRNQIIEA